MTRKVVFTALILCLLFLSVVPAAVQAGSELRVISSSAETDFPMRLIFNVSASSDDAITDVRLCYYVERLEHAQVIAEAYVPVTPATSISEQWVWDMRRTGGLPPGSSVVYWWRISDAGGGTVASTPERLMIEDDRYDWHSITEDMVTLYWYRGDNAFADELMEATQQALSRLEDNTGATLEEPVSLYIYASAQDLQGSMIFPQEWTGGVAFTSYGIVTIGIGTSAGEIEWGKRTIAHELTHLVVHRLVFNPYNGLPTWLDEGLSMTAEGDLQPAFTTQLQQAVADGTLISVRSLASPFSAYTDRAILSYAQSYILVDFLIREYGRDKMFELLSLFSGGISYDDALLAVYGFDADGLDILWRASLGNTSRVAGVGR